MYLQELPIFFPCEAHEMTCFHFFIQDSSLRYTSPEWGFQWEGKGIHHVSTCEWP